MTTDQDWPTIHLHIKYLGDINTEVQEKVVGNNVEDKIIDEWVDIAIEKMERYQELVDRSKGCLKDLCEKKEADIRKKENEMQEERFKRAEDRRNEAGHEKEE